MKDLYEFVKSLVDDMPEPPQEDWHLDGKSEAFAAADAMARIEIGERAKYILESEGLL